MAMPRWVARRFGWSSSPAAISAKAVSSASRSPVRRLDASALGLYELHINGQRVGKDDSPRLDGIPQARSLPDIRRHADAEAAATTRSARSSATAGTAGYFGIRRQARTLRRPAALDRAARTSNTPTDRRETIVTDDSWKAVYGPIREADLLMGCRYDANRGNGQAGIKPALTIREVAAGRGQRSVMPKLEASARPGDRAERSKSSRQGRHASRCPDTYVFDLGQNMVGWVRLKLADQGRADDSASLFRDARTRRHALHRFALRGAGRPTLTSSKGGEINWEPKFTFHGFRYVEITGSERAAGARCGHRHRRACGHARARASSNAPIRWSTSSSTTSSGARRGITSKCPPIARSAMSGWAGRAMRSSSSRRPRTTSTSRRSSPSGWSI